MKKPVVLLLVLISLLLLASCGTGTLSYEESEVHIHEFGEWTTTEPTCTLTGSRTRKCSCGESQKETLAATGHSLVHFEATAAGCTAPGNVDYWRCTVCQKNFTDKTAKAVLSDEEVILPIINHSYTYHKAIASSCVKKGNVLYCECTRCGQLFSADEEHTPMEEEEVFLPLSAHDMTYHEKVDADCAATGTLAHWHCAQCNRDYADEEGTERLESILIEKTPHRYVDGICADCGEKDSFTVSFVTGEGKAVEPIEVKKDTKMSSYPLTSRTGYAFCGWYPSATATTPWIFDKDVVTEPITLYARWVATDSPYLAIPVQSAQKRDNLSSVSLTGFTRGSVYNDELCLRETNFNLVVSQSYLFIKFIPITVTVTLYANNGFFTTEEGFTRTLEMGVPYYSSYSLPLPEKRGFYLSGWTGEVEPETSGVYFCDSLLPRAFTAEWASSCSHTMTTMARKEPTCTIDGNIEYHHCSVCGAYYSDEEYTVDCWDVTLPATGHSGGQANCKERASCVKCGAEYGEKTYHSGGIATCIQRAVCSFCLEEYGELRDHIGGRATCVKLAVCTVCNEEYGELGEHTPGEVVCENYLVCSLCEERYGELTHHDYQNGACVKCGATEALSYRYDAATSGYYITDTSTSLVDLVLPRFFDGIPVVGIEGGAFAANSAIRSITIPSSVRYFGENAFYGCTGLTAVYIDDIASWQQSSFIAPSSNPLTYAKNLYVGKRKVTSLVFEDCSVSAYAFCNLSVSSIELKENVRYVGEGAFSGLNDTTEILLRSEKATDYWDGNWRSGCTALVTVGYTNLQTSDLFRFRLSGNAAVLTEYLGSDTVVKVPAKLNGRNVIDVGTAFVGNAEITSLFLPSTLTAFSESSFFGCEALEIIYMADTYDSWEQKGLSDIWRMVFYSPSSCVHDYSARRYVWDEDGDPVLIAPTPNTDRYALCSIENPKEPLLCAVCNKPVSFSVEIIRAHIYQDGNCTVCGEPEPTAGWVFTLKKNAYYLTGYTVQPTGEVVIPSLYNGLPVEGIEDELFEGCPITSVYIPRTIRQMDNAFIGCTTLTTVYFDAANCRGKSDGGFFVGCTSLTAIIGKNVTVIPDHLFYQADVRSIQFIAPVCEKIGDFAFAGNENLFQLTLPSSVHTLGFGAFRDCVGLVTLFTPECDLIIGRSAFRNCVTLSSIVLGAKTTEVHPTAFLNTYWYNNHADGVLYLGNTAVGYKGTPTDVVIEEGTLYVADRAFYESEITSITLPSSLLAIGSEAFASCLSLTEIIYGAVSCRDLTETSDAFYRSGAADGIVVTVTQNVKYLPAYLFCNVSKISSLTASSPEKVGINAFYGTDWLRAQTGVIYIGKALYTVKNPGKKVEIAEGTLTISDGAFAGNTAIGEIAFPSSLRSIGKNALSGCTGITKIYFNVRDLLYFDADLFTEIGSSSGWTLTVGKDATLLPYLFYRAKKLTAVLFETGACTSLPGYVFASCPRLSSVTLSDSVSVVASYAFDHDTSLTTVHFGESISSVTGLSFAYCPLQTITSSSDTFVAEDGLLINVEFSSAVLGTANAYDTGNLTAIDARAFYARTGLTGFRLGDDIISVGQEAFAYCADLEFLTIGASLTSFGSRAFYQCTGIKTIRYNAENCADLPTDNGVFEGAVNIHFYVGKDVLKLPKNLLMPSENNVTLAFVVVGKSVETIEQYVFPVLEETTVFCYGSTEEDWNNIIKKENNDLPATEDIWFYSESAPTLTEDGTAFDGKFWRYVSGEVTLWVR